MPVPTHISDHVAQGLALLTPPFQGQPNVQGWLTALLNRVQELEDCIFDVLAKIQLVNHPLPGGPWSILDALGSRIGAPPRNGMTDAQYLPIILLQARVNRSSGLAEDVIQVAALLFTGAVYREFYPAGWDLTVLGATDAQVQALSTYLLATRAAGTAGTIRYSDWAAPTGVLIPDWHSGTVSGATGFAYPPSNLFMNAFAAGVKV